VGKKEVEKVGSWEGETGGGKMELGSRNAEVGKKEVGKLRR
jgi:hypothetical protein